MLLMRIVVAVLCGLSASAVHAGQSTSRVVDRTDARGGTAPWRLVQTTTVTGGRQTMAESELVADTDGRIVPVRETTVEVIRAGSVVRTTAETLTVEISGQQRLVETRVSDEDGLPAGGVRRTDTTRRADVNGRPAIFERATERTSVTAEGRQTQQTIDRPDLDGRLRPQERVEHSERRIAPQAVRASTTELRTDLDHRWHEIEIRHREVSTDDVVERTEESVHQRDLNGVLSERERRVSRSSTQDGQRRDVTEIFTDDGGGYMARPSMRPILSQRIRRTTLPQPDGGRRIVEEVEERSLVASGDPLRLVRRTVATVRPAGPGRLRVERQTFERDLNNRLVPTTLEVEDTTEP